MRGIHGIFEVAIPVRELERSEAFYLGVLGLTSGLREEERRWHFLRAGGDAGMLVLQETPGEWPPAHFAFTTTDDDIEAAAATLREHGVEVAGPSRTTGCPRVRSTSTIPTVTISSCAPLWRRNRC